ncbi:MAG: hypothetical protein R2909_02895, partial [Gemmatimonadales bacterium]
MIRVINAASVGVPVGDSAEARNSVSTIESPIAKTGVWSVGAGEQVQDTVRPVAPSPAIWPDTALTVTSPELGGVGYHRNIYRVYFDDSTSAVTINAFLATFNATVIGGLVPVGDPTNPGYYVQIPDPGAAWPVVDSIG